MTVEARTENKGMKLDEFIAAVRRNVWDATADASGAGCCGSVNMTIFLDEHGWVTQDQKKACTVTMDVYYSEQWLKRIPTS